MLFKVVRTIRKGCNGAVIFKSGVEIDLNPINPKVNRWIVKGWIKETKPNVNTEIHNDKDAAGHHDERAVSD